jgi:hypothetical protein
VRIDVARAKSFRAERHRDANGSAPIPGLPSNLGAAPLLSTDARDQFAAVADGGNFTEVKPPYFVTDGQKDIAACFDRESPAVVDHDSQRNSDSMT